MAKKKKANNASRWTVAAGRQIYFDGEPFLSVGREGDAEPVEADGATHLIVDLFNREGATPASIRKQHMSSNPAEAVPIKLKNKLLR